MRDLQESTKAIEHLETGVLIVGGGIAGLLIAAQLARCGIGALVLESGAASGAFKTSDPLNIVEQRGQPYRGAAEGRVRGLGGTSRLWGGAMLPFLPCDMGPHTAGWPVDWPVNYADVEPRFSEIEQMFSLPPGPYELSDAMSSCKQDFLLRSAKWPTFRMRNIANILDNDLRNMPAEIWLNATVTGFAFAENGRISRVLAESPNGGQIEARAGLVVMAAGAIESTRLLLLMDAAQDTRIFRPDGQLGRYFFDHLSTAAAVVEPIDRARLNHIFGLKFERGGMRDLRIEPGPTLRCAEGLPAAFSHVAAISEEAGGFDALRNIYRSLQSRSGLDLSQLKRLTRDLPWLARAGWWRFVNSRLLYPRRARFELTLVIEQFPNESSTISLSTTERDGFGAPRASINWRTSEADVSAFSCLQGRLCAYWHSSRFAHLGGITPVPREVWTAQLKSGGADVYHPGGTTRMARNPSAGVVDGDLRAFRVPNLTVVSTSCFPTGGGANPTFMLMAFALRAADRIAAEMRNATIVATSSATPTAASARTAQLQSEKH